MRQIPVSVDIRNCLTSRAHAETCWGPGGARPSGSCGPPRPLLLGRSLRCSLSSNTNCTALLFTGTSSSLLSSCRLTKRQIVIFLTNIMDPIMMGRESILGEIQYLSVEVSIPVEIFKWCWWSMENVNFKVSCHVLCPQPGIIFQGLITVRNKHIHQNLHPNLSCH